jgi:hypothetical protein
MLSGLQANLGTRRYFEGMLVARQEVLTQPPDLSGGPEGRVLKGTSAALQTSTRTTSLALWLAPYSSALASCVALPPASLQSCTLQVTQRAFTIIQGCPRG